MYSILLYMKTRVTFRVAPDLADALRDLPNQTQFVEQALREALREKCPACGGTGRAMSRSVRVSNFRRSQLPPLSREVALRLRELMTFARRAAATDLGLRAADDGLAFVVSRGEEVLLRGSLDRHATRLELGGGH
ncbi:MAG: hypothetical protein K0R38_2421 [Polyangiaceae bacterium]|jgi:hypothetical protein|nr:hypothetical protein [Polyangiaceae bacterium]